MVLLRRGLDDHLDYGAETPVRQKIWAFIAAAFAGVALAIIWAGNSGFTDFAPGVTTIQGASICSGSPTTGNLLIFGGTTWCGATTINPPSGTSSALIINDTNANAARTLLELDTSGRTANSRGLYEGIDGEVSLRADQIFADNGIILTGGTLDLPSSGVVYASDLTEVAAPRTPLTIYSPVGSTGTLSLPIDYAPSVLMHVRRWTLLVNPAPSGCSTWPVYEIQTDSGAQSASAISLATSPSGGSVTGLSLPIGASGFVEVAVTTQGVGCTWSNGTLEAIIELTTD